MYEDNEPLENTNIDLITIDGAYKSNEYTFAFTVFFCCLFGILLIFTSCAMFFQYKRLVLGDALRKAREEISVTLENSDMSVTDSNEVMDGFHGSNEASSSESSMDTLEEYGFPGAKGSAEKYLFEDDYAHIGTPNPRPNSLQDHSSDGNKSDYSNPEHVSIEMHSIPKKRHSGHNSGNAHSGQNSQNSVRGFRRFKRKSKHKLDKEKKRKKKKKKKPIWQTIVFSHSPTEDS